MQYLDKGLYEVLLPIIQNGEGLVQEEVKHSEDFDGPDEALFLVEQAEVAGGR